MAKLKKAPESKQNTLKTLLDVGCGEAAQITAVKPKPDLLFIVPAEHAAGAAPRSAVKPHTFAVMDAAEHERIMRILPQDTEPAEADDTGAATGFLKYLSNILKEE